MTTAQKFLEKMNTEYLALHKKYEDLFWVTYMGDNTLLQKRDKALKALDNFRSDAGLREQAEGLVEQAKEKEKQRLKIWIDFFAQYQLSSGAKKLKDEIVTLETKIGQIRSSRKEGYLDPVTKKFVVASALKMRTMIQTHPDEKVRRACFQAREEMVHDCLDKYVELVKSRNAFAIALGYADFYDYKLRSVDKLTKQELFSLFEEIADKTSGHFAKIRELEKKQPGLRQPWNFAYYMTGDFTKAEDPYFQFDESILRWGRSFAALGIDFQNGKLQLDLLDRQGKWNNGFCHWPDLVHFEKGKRIPGSANFTCNVVAGQVGSGISGYRTLFHEGGHAAHLLNSEQKEVCLNHEYDPMTASWAETHSMFIDTMFESIEWKQRYGKNAAGEAYPFSLFAEKEEQLNLLKPAYILGLVFVCVFEREVYELKNPTVEKILQLAKKNYRRFYDQKSDSVSALNVPHIYNWESACGYHGYGLALIALSQWREYFYKKYGYIVDNPKVGQEMKATWKWGASKDFKTAIKTATGAKLSSKALIKEIDLPTKQVIKRAKERLKRMETVKEFNKPVDLKVQIKMVHGKKVVATNKESFEKMAQQYGTWVKKEARSQK